MTAHNGHRSVLYLRLRVHYPGWSTESIRYSSHNYGYCLWFKYALYAFYHIIINFDLHEIVITLEKEVGDFITIIIGYLYLTCIRLNIFGQIFTGFFTLHVIRLIHLNFRENHSRSIYYCSFLWVRLSFITWYYLELI